MYITKIILLVALTVFTRTYIFSQQPLPSERNELIRFYNSVENVPWDTTASLSSWEGVTLNESGEVTRLALPNRNLSGSLPNLNLKKLEVLKLNDNQLNDEIPAFSQLPLLDSLILYNNQFSGIIEAYQLPELRFLNLSQNDLVGSIPNFSGMPKLEVIGLNRNSLNTTIPDFQNISSLRELYLFDCSMVGVIPDFTNIPNLQILQLGNNQLTGELPDFTNLPNLESLDIWVNALNGPFPSLINCPELTRIDCSKNNFTSLPAFSYLTNLQELIIDENFFTFQDILPNLSVSTFKYAGQKPVGSTQTIQGNEGESFTINLGVDEEVSTSTYQWVKDGDSQPYRITNSPQLEFTVLGLDDAGTYTCEITNAQAPELTLFTQPITLQVLPVDTEGPCAVPMFEHTLEGKNSAFYNQSSGSGTYSWQFGDGIQSSLPNPQHTYADTGIYQVCLTVSDDCGQKTFCREIQVFDCDSLVPVFDWAVKLPDGAGTMEINENNELFIAGTGFFSKYSSTGNQLFLKEITGATAHSIAVDVEGNILLTGMIEESADLDPSPGQSLVSGNNDIFISKYSPEGNLIWGFRLGDETDMFGGERGSGIDTDLEGNIYVTGYFDGTIDIAPGISLQNISSIGNRDIFIAKYSPNGELLFGFAVGGDDIDLSTDLEIKGDRIYISGNMVSSNGFFSLETGVIANPGAGGYNNPILIQYELDGTFESLTLTSTEPGPDLEFAGTNLALAIDPLLNVYLGGAKSFPNEIGLSYSKLDNTNNVQFFAYLFTSNPVGRPFGETKDVDYDFEEAIYITGQTGGKGFISGESGAFTNTFLGKYTLNGSQEFLFSPDIEGAFGTGSGSGLSLQTNSKGDIYTISSLLGTSFDFDPSDNQALFEENGTYLIKYSQICSEIACTLSATLSDPIDATCGDPNGEISLSVTRAQGNYTVNWSTGATGDSLTAITSGQYTVTVRDEAGCEVTRSFTIMDTDVPAISITSISDATCGENNGSATAEITGGLPPYQINWSNGQVSAGISVLTARNLSEGTFTVVTTDDNGCQDTDTVMIDAVEDLAFTAESTNANCGEENGTLSVVISSGTPPYQITWPDGQDQVEENTYLISDLKEGIYPLTITDSLGCEAIDTVTVLGNGVPEISLNIQNARCGLNNGAVTADITGGTSPFEVTWDNGQTGSSIENLASGMYTVTVTDSNDCEVSSTISITNTTAPEIETSVEDENCDLSNGAAVVTVSGGSPSYQILWSNGQTGDTLSNLNAGTYRVTVIDQNACEISDTVVITNLPGPTLTTQSQNATCDEDNGIAWVSVAGGTAPYEISWNNEATTDTISNLAPGEYTVTVTDEIGCLVEENTIIELTDGPSVTLEATNATCDSTNGTVTAIVSGGTPPYQVSWSTGNSSTQNADFTETLLNLSEGIYGISIQDENQCELSKNIEVTTSGIPEITLLSVTDANCNQSDGSATISVSGGAGNYLIEWENGQTSQTATGLSSGQHLVTVRDELDCQSELMIDINEIEKIPEAGFSSFTEGLEVSFTNQSKQANQYQWEFGDGTTSEIANPLHTFPDTGSYQVCLIAGNACATDTTCSTLEIQQATNCNLVLTTSSTPSDCLEANGTASVSVFPAGDNFTYWWQTAPAQFTQQATGLSKGRYQVIVDNGSCRDTSSVVVENVGTMPVADFTYTIDSNTVSFTNLSQNGELYNWNFGNGYLAFTQNPTYTYPVPGVYTVTLEVSNTCGVDTLKQSINLLTTNPVDDIKRESFAVLPNPNNGMFDVRLDNFQTGNSIWSVYSLYGKRLSIQKVFISAPNYTQPLNLSALPTGIYLMNIETTNSKYYFRFEIIR